MLEHSLPYPNDLELGGDVYSFHPLLLEPRGLLCRPTAARSGTLPLVLVVSSLVSLLFLRWKVD